MSIFASMTDEQMFAHDDRIFHLTVMAWKTGRPIVVMNNGRGDHIVFKRVLADLKNPIVFSCYPDIIPGGSIETAVESFGSLEQWDIYRYMDVNNWTGSLESAFRKMYNV